MSETPEGSAEQPEWQNDAPHSAWGDPISPERRAELQEMFERQKQWEEQKDHDPGQSVFNGERLTGAEVFWLAAMALREEEGDLDRAAAKLRMEDGYFDLSGLHLEGVNLREAELQHAHLNGAHLDGANLDWVQLQRATLNGAQLNYAHLVQAHLDGAILRQAHLDGANLHLAVFQDADLTEAHVQPPGLTITDTLATLTAVEAFFGLFIEGIFIAAFTRRVTGN